MRAVSRDGVVAVKRRTLVAPGGTRERSPDANSVAGQVRLYRHIAIDAMRLELGLTGSAKPLEGEA
jgi:hypothetical protein